MHIHSRCISTVYASTTWAKTAPHHRPTSLCQWRECTAGRFGYWLCNHHYECFIIQRVWCWRIENLNRDWICDGCVSSSSCCGSSSPLPTITTSSSTKRSRSVDLDTTYVDGGYLHVSSTKVEFSDNKSPAPNQCSRLWPNFHLKDSANETSSFLFLSIATQHSASEVTCTALVSILVPMVYFGLVGAIASVFFVSFLTFLIRVFWCLYAPPRPKKTHTNLKKKFPCEV